MAHKAKPTWFDASLITAKLADSLKQHPAIHSAATDADRTAFAFGYLQSTMADLMLTNPKAFEIVADALATVNQRIIDEMNSK